MGTLAKWLLYLVASPFVLGGLVAAFGGMLWEGLAVFVVGAVVMGYARSLSQTKQRKKTGPEVHVDDGLWCVPTGKRSFEVTYDKTWIESRGDESTKKPSRTTLKALKACNVRTSPETECDAVALQAALDNVDLSCSSCGQEVVSDDRRCDHCGKNPWSKPITMTLRHRN